MLGAVLCLVFGWLAGGAEVVVGERIDQIGRGNVRPPEK